MDNVFVPYTYRETRAGIEAVSMPSELFRERKLFLVGEIDSTSMGVLMQSLKRLFMSVFDIGKLQFANNKTVDFSQTIIIATTNAGYNSASSPIGFTSEYGSLSDSVKALSADFDIALLNRFTKILYFHSISEEIFREIICDKYSREVSEIKKHRIISYILPDTLPDDAVDMLVSESYNPAFGARPATRVVREYNGNILVNDF